MSYEYIDEKVNFYTLEQKEAMLAEQVEILNNIFKDLSEDKKKMLEKIISSVAFMSVELRNLEEVIKRNGQVDKYRNGACQSGYKKSATSEAYNTMKKTYLADVKLLTELLNEDNKSLENDDVLMKFINGKG